MAGGNKDPKKEFIVLPERIFLYTVDQLAVMLAVSEARLRTEFLYYVGRSTGIQGDKMPARNIAPAGDTPEWRVSNKEFAKWLKRRGFHFTQNGDFVG